MHRKELSYNNLHIRLKICTSNITVLIQQSYIDHLKNVFTISISPLLGPFPQFHLTTSSTIDSTILMISIALFVFGSARESNGSGGGDSSAVVEKINQFEVTKANDEAKGHKTITIRLSRSAASSAFFAASRVS
jgi:hypothetical protein